MARLNTRTSATPASRAGTVDSLYRDPTPASRLISTARQSSYSVLSPGISSQNSDKENDIPASREATPRAKTKGLAAPSRRTQRLMTPDSGNGNANKRRRTGDYEQDDEASGVPVFEDHEDEPSASEEPSDEQSQRPPTPDEDDAQFYDPDQAPEERRMLAAALRDHHREVLGMLMETLLEKLLLTRGRRP
jgi:hypothetical protein